MSFRFFSSIPNRTSKPNLHSQWKTDTTYGTPISSNHPKMMLKFVLFPSLYGTKDKNHLLSLFFACNLLFTKYIKLTISLIRAVRIFFSSNVKFSGKIKPINSLQSAKVPPSKTSPSFITVFFNAIQKRAYSPIV